MTEPDVRQVLVHPAVWPHLELWLAGRGLILARVPVEDDLPTYAMVLAAPGDAERVVRDAARQAAGQPQADECPNCRHARHLPGTECEAGVEHGPKRWHRCLCLARPGAALACPPQMTCQGGTLGYSDIWYLQHGHRLIDEDGAISSEALRVEERGPAVGQQPTQQPATEAPSAAAALEVLAFELATAKRLIEPSEVRAAIAAHRAEILHEAAAKIRQEVSDQWDRGNQDWDVHDAAGLLRRLADGSAS